MIDKVDNKMVSMDKPRTKLPRFVVLKKRIDCSDGTFYPGDNVDTFKYKGVRKVLEDGIRHSQRTNYASKS